MLGGDNMDAALARHVEERMLAGGRKLSAAQWTQLVQAARDAKESLLGRQRARTVRHCGGRRRQPACWAARCRLKCSATKSERLILDGFFPACAPDATPRRAARTALQELGLPYAQDAAITRHLAAFLRQHAAAGFAALGRGAGAGNALPRPDAILFNGGVFNSPKISHRLIEVVSAWWPEAPRIPGCWRTIRWTWRWPAARFAMGWPEARPGTAHQRRIGARILCRDWPAKRNVPRPARSA